MTVVNSLNSHDFKAFELAEIRESKKFVNNKKKIRDWGCFWIWICNDIQTIQIFRVYLKRKGNH